MKKEVEITGFVLTNCDNTEIGYYGNPSYEYILFHRNPNNRGQFKPHLYEAIAGIAKNDHPAVKPRLYHATGYGYIENNEITITDFELITEYDYKFLKDIDGEDVKALLLRDKSGDPAIFV